ncbi:cysteine--tRNA ligase [Neomegalonema sp.]|uniref:cysteine--tRNA ligase n=1 Tax=Neomegalonema sp. TaxID=2039713 RepID=UPI0026383D80|nr:cysteine--tRNA ligase [Neomegalonema sp.]MDD2867328.1 cysteine--tRNA ligase [Neomegalonema sp.]
MVVLQLHNSLTREKAPFAPLDPERVRMYVCGPTVYDRAHMGNARPVVVFDVLFRLLRHVHGPQQVVYARNFTDVDDKINARAAETRRSIYDITEQTIGWFHQDMDALGALRPNHEPRATAYIKQMVRMIGELIAHGAAYEAEGHVLFHVPSDPGYGRLSRRSLKEMIAGARVEVAPYKRDPMDFVLWKPSTPDQPGWRSPWGVGRPGWHIECSAMSEELLGTDFDIHAGGIDLQFPHHENECAQSLCARPGSGFARVWMHNGILTIDGEKMSKSLGNFITPRALLDKGIPGEVLRFSLLTAHYRQPLDWTERLLEDSRRTLEKWRRIAGEAAPAAEPPAGVLAALADDLNTPLAIAELHKLAHAGDGAGLKAGAALMGLLTPEMGGWDVLPEAGAEEAARIEALLEARAEAKKSRDFARADALRDGLKAAGVVVTDKPQGAEWSLSPEFDAARLPQP